MKDGDATPAEDWVLYRGDNQQRAEWEMPEPPPWRPRRATRERAAECDVIRTPLSSASRAKGQAYQSDPDIRRVVNAALHLRRPLLITGDPGTGKSSLIDSVAFELQLGEPLRWPVTSRSTLHDALYSYDAIGRVQSRRDQEKPDDRDVGAFIELGPLGTSMLPARRPRALLIDEIDKADVDLPNDLLNVIEEGYFTIPELSRLGRAPMSVQIFRGQDKAIVTGGLVESYEFPFVVMTSNGERDFPAAFLRRCLQMRMPDPGSDPQRLRAIVRAHLGDQKVIEAEKLIEGFVDRASSGHLLATDQLLNAIQLVMGGYAMADADRSDLLRILTAELGRKS